MKTFLLIHNLNQTLKHILIAFVFFPLSFLQAEQLVEQNFQIPNLSKNFIPSSLTKLQGQFIENLEKDEGFLSSALSASSNFITPRTAGSFIDSMYNRTGDSSDSVGKDYFKSKEVDLYEENEEEVSEEDGPIEDWEKDNILGVREKSSEDLLSSRGFPRMNQSDSILDLRGLPRPTIQAFDEKENFGAKKPEVEEVKERAKFRDIFKF